MDTTQFHTQYAASMAAFLSQLPDPGLRIAVRQQGDPFFRPVRPGRLAGRAVRPSPRPIPPGTTPSTPAASVPRTSCSGH